MIKQAKPKVVSRRRGRLPKKKARAKDSYGPSKQLRKERAIKPPASGTDPPEWLSKVARMKWKEIAPILSDQGLLTVVDRDPLALYCTAFADYVECCEIITQDGIKQSEAIIRTKNRSANIMKQFALEFGLTPAARSRVTIDEQESEDQSIKDIFGD